VVSYVSGFSLPPRTAGLAKSPISSRTNSRTSAHTSSRLSTTFTSLFGKSATPAQPTPSTSSSAKPDTEPVVEISVFTIDQRIIGQNVARGIVEGIKREIEESLTDLPLWAVERVHEFTQDLYPAVNAPKKAPTTAETDSWYIVNTFQETPEAASQRFQNFYALLEQDLRLEWAPSQSRHSETDSNSEFDQERRMQEKMASEIKIRDILETVERTVCSLFYDRQV
jgi:hypothetical protein